MNSGTKPSNRARRTFRSRIVLIRSPTTLSGGSSINSATIDFSIAPQGKQDNYGATWEVLGDSVTVNTNDDIFINVTRAAAAGNRDTIVADAVRIRKVDGPLETSDTAWIIEQGDAPLVEYSGNWTFEEDTPGNVIGFSSGSLGNDPSSWAATGGLHNDRVQG